MANADFKFTRIQNEILEAFGRTRIPGEARQILDVILRKTYGFQKKEDVISLSQFSAATNLKRPTVVRAIRKLLSMNIIIKKDNGKMGLQKRTSLWKPLSKKITVPSVIKKDNFIDKKDNKPLSKKIHTKDIYKETNTKDNTNMYLGKKAKTPHIKEKPEKEPPQRDPRVTICREYWYEQYKNIIGEPYPKNYAKDSSNWKWFLKLYNSVAWAKGFTDFYLQWNNPFAKQSGHSLDVFIKTLPSMLEQKIQITHWVKKHEERGGLKKASETIKELFPNGI